MKKAALLILTLAIFLSAFSQDFIIKRNGDEIKAKVLEVALTIVNIKTLTT